MTLEVRREIRGLFYTLARRRVPFTSRRLHTHEDMP